MPSLSDWRTMMVVLTASVGGGQLLLLLLYSLRIKRQHRRLSEIKTDDFRAMPAVKGSFAWLEWVRLQFGGERLSPFGREEVIREFDRRQFDDWRYGWLARMGVM